MLQWCISTQNLNSASQNYQLSTNAWLLRWELPAKPRHANPVSADLCMARAVELMRSPFSQEPPGRCAQNLYQVLFMKQRLPSRSFRNSGNTMFSLVLFFRTAFFCFCRGIPPHAIKTFQNVPKNPGNETWAQLSLGCTTFHPALWPQFGLQLSVLFWPKKMWVWREVRDHCITTLFWRNQPWCRYFR